MIIMDSKEHLNVKLVLVTSFMVLFSIVLVVAVILAARLHFDMINSVTQDEKDDYTIDYGQLELQLNNNNSPSDGSEGAPVTQSGMQEYFDNIKKDESNVPLCQRTDLSYEDALSCAEQLRQQREAEERKMAEEATTKWCNDNVSRIYDSYNSKLLFENDRYEREVASYVTAQMASGASTSESTLREIAEKQYGPLHTLNVDNIIYNYVREIQSHGCSLSGYGF